MRQTAVTQYAEYQTRQYVLHKGYRFVLPTLKALKGPTKQHLNNSLVRNWQVATPFSQHGYIISA